MTIRTRLALTSAALMVGVATSACGGGGSGSGSDGAPTDASKDDFCSTYSDLFADLMGDMSDVPSDEQMATAVKDWADKLEAVGTPEDITDDARAGFDDLVDQANSIDADDFSIDKLDELAQGGKGASEEAQEQATAFATYLTDTCGNPLDDLEMPEMPSETP
ncbi:hypothetical protein EUA93_07105 [Nocardioides oleivorans]|uniref:Uncharacterized protein n=1 Tax=Nocardioides oleivorans TaxID=273676 RepID=A0A4Q2RXX8_9ACTN|nr:hypothetical protein [Nocardioides oleivorans]RYB94131.1 hypothetical protein EUA93_07105 [Nocardioides oleivorans]